MKGPKEQGAQEGHTSNKMDKWLCFSSNCIAPSLWLAADNSQTAYERDKFLSKMNRTALRQVNKFVSLR